MMPSGKPLELPGTNVDLSLRQRPDAEGGDIVCPLGPQARTFLSYTATPKTFSHSPGPSFSLEVMDAPVSQA